MDKDPQPEGTPRTRLSLIREALRLSRTHSEFAADLRTGLWLLSERTVRPNVLLVELRVTAIRAEVLAKAVADVLHEARDREDSEDDDDR